MLYQVTHTTRYLYQTPVSHCLNEVHLTPRDLPNQHVRETDIRVEPEPAFIRHRNDYYGNDVTSFEVLEKHDRLEAIAHSLVEGGAGPAAPLPSISWEDAREIIADQPDTASLEASEFIYSSPYVPGV